MLKIARMTMIAAAVALAMPAVAAGGFVEEAGDSMSSLEQYRYFPSEEHRGSKAFAWERAPGPAPAQAAIGDTFRAVGGEPGWELSQHKYVHAGGRFAHSDECDHAIRFATTPTPQEVDAGRRFSPGT